MNDFYSGTLVIGPLSGALDVASALADECPDVAVLQASLHAPETIIDVSQRYRAAGKALVVIADSEDAVPLPARCNLATVVEAVPSQ